MAASGDLGAPRTTALSVLAALYHQRANPGGERVTAKPISICPRINSGANRVLRDWISIAAIILLGLACSRDTKTKPAEPHHLTLWHSYNNRNPVFNEIARRLPETKTPYQDSCRARAIRRSFAEANFGGDRSPHA